jgi:hypothetical protein
VKRRTLETERGGITRNGDAPGGDQADEVAPRKVPVKHEEKKRPPGQQPTSASEFVIASIARARKRAGFWALGFFLSNLVWLCILLCTVVFFTAELASPKKVAIIDPSHTMYIAPLQNASTSKDLLDEVAVLTTVSYLQRNPNGLDLPELFAKTFGTGSAQRVQAEMDAWRKQAAPTNLRWKPEIEKNEVINSIESNVVLDRVTGRVVQSGIINGVEERQVVPFVLSLKLTRNPALISQARYPYAVADYAISYPQQDAVPQSNP